MRNLSRADVALLLGNSDDPRVCSMAQDATLVQACTNVLNEAMAVACVTGMQQLKIGSDGRGGAPAPWAAASGPNPWVIGSHATKTLNSTLKMAADPPRTKGELALALVDKGLSISGMAEEATDSQYVRAANFVGNQMMSSIALTKVAGMTPARTAVFVSLTLAEKVTGAAGYAQFDQCKVAIASLAVTTGLTVVAAPTGIGAVVGAVAIAAESFNVIGQCRAR